MHWKTRIKHHVEAVIGLLPIFVLAGGCTLDEDLGNPVTYNSALVVTTDYATGSYSAISMDDLSATRDVNTVHFDATCRFDPITGTPFIIQRFGGDAIAVLDPSDFSIVNEYSTGAGTNPHDIAVVAEDRAYISLYGSSHMLIVHPMTGEEIGSVDLSEYADADGAPEMDALFVHGDKVFAFVSRLDKGFVPTGVGMIIVIDGNTGEVDEAISLAAKNPYERVSYSDGIQKLVIASPGDFAVIDDGGIELFDPEDRSLSGLIVREEDLGGNVTGAVIATAEKGYALVAAPGDMVSDTHVVRFDPNTGENLGALIKAKGWIYSSIALSPDGTELWITDRTPEAPGVRIFDVATDTEKTDSAINVGLPPSTVCFTGI